MDWILVGERKEWEEKEREDWILRLKLFWFLNKEKGTGFCHALSLMEVFYFSGPKLPKF